MKPRDRLTTENVPCTRQPRTRKGWVARASDSIVNRSEMARRGAREGALSRGAPSYRFKERVGLCLVLEDYVTRIRTSFKFPFPACGKSPLAHARAARHAPETSDALAWAWPRSCLLGPQAPCQARMWGSAVRLVGDPREVIDLSGLAGLACEGARGVELRERAEERAEEVRARFRVRVRFRVGVRVGVRVRVGVGVRVRDRVRVRVRANLQG